MTTTFDLNDIPPFEGPEKKLEVDFLISKTNPRGLRDICTEKWTNLLTLISCSILSELRNDYCDSFVLSESSLFVYSDKVMLKTCGQITLLNCIELLLEYGKSVGAVETKISFSRRNFFYPDQQIYPHNSFEHEVEFLKQHFPSGESYIFGPHTCDHHYMFVYYNQAIAVQKTNTLEVLMTGLDRKVMEQFYKNQSFISSSDVMNRSGITKLLTSTTLVDSHSFDPLGFSMNGLDSSQYFTIHITPQPECSFVSFETNCDLNNAHDLVERVVQTFKPASFTMLVVSSEAFKTEGFPNFFARGNAFHDFEGSGDVLTWFSFRKNGTESASVSPRTTATLLPNTSFIEPRAEVSLLGRDLSQELLPVGVLG